MSPYERNIYALAENLSTPVYELKEKMPWSEMMGWAEYYRGQKPDDGNLLNKSPDDFLKGMMG